MNNLFMKKRSKTREKKCTKTNYDVYAKKMNSSELNFVCLKLKVISIRSNWAGDGTAAAVSAVSAVTAMVRKHKWVMRMKLLFSSYIMRTWIFLNLEIREILCTDRFSPFLNVNSSFAPSTVPQHIGSGCGCVVGEMEVQSETKCSSRHINSGIWQGSRQRLSWVEWPQPTDHNKQILPLQMNDSIKWLIAYFAVNSPYTIHLQIHQECMKHECEENASKNNRTERYLEFLDFL